MRKDFISVKQMAGELKLSQVKQGLRCTVTTKEIIFQKPHRSYHILFDDIIEMLPFNIPPQTITLPATGGEKVKATFGSSYYKIMTEKAKIYNRNGIYEQDQMELIIPLSQKFLRYVSRYSDLYVVQ